jgi:glycosyltransferase involved in cell wall biosynthesis
MAGPGIRYHYIAETLSQDFDVTVGFFEPTYLPDDAFKRSYKIRHIDAFYFEKGFAGFKYVIAHWLSDSMINFCNKHGIFMVFDLYVPGPVENLAGALFSGESITRDKDFEFGRAARMYRIFFENGDLFLVSNRRQLDYWTGYFFGADQVRPSNYPRRPVFDRMIYAPMGIDTKKNPTHKHEVLKGVVPGIKKTDKVLLWTGGIWGHFDGAVAIRAMDKLKDSRPEIKLFFLGVHHPNPNVPEMRESRETRKLADSLGLTGRNVFFNEGWVEYQDRINYLLEADAAISTHKVSIESEFSHRTRILDHLWAGLPTISTEGDYFSDQVIKPRELGVVIPPDSVDSLVNAIMSVLDPKLNALIRKNIVSVRAAYSWSSTLHVLQQFLKEKPQKLQVLEKSQRLKTGRGPLKIVRKLIPGPVKRILIRVLRLR